MFYKEPGRHLVFCGICEIPKFFAKDKDRVRKQIDDESEIGVELEPNDEEKPKVAHHSLWNVV